MWRKSFTFMFLDAETHHRRMFGAVLCVTAFADLNFPLGDDIQLIFSLYPGTRTLKNWITFQRNVFIHRMPTGKLWNQAFLRIVSHSKLDIYSKECPAKWTPLLGVIIGSFNIDNGNGSENATFRMNSLFFFSSLKIDVLHMSSIKVTMYVTRDVSQRRFLAQHGVALLLRHCFEWLQHCSMLQ